MRSKYWSCSKFADWLRGTAKPYALDWHGWDKWRDEARASHPWRYWLAEEFLGKVQDLISWPADKFHSIKYYINNRWVSKTHAMTSNLERGKWHEFETRLLHCMFDELVNFVEIESAWHYTIWNDEARKKYCLPWYAGGIWRCWRTWRCPEAGLASLEWQTKLTLGADYGLSPTDPDYGKPTGQAITAQETLDLYLWWKNIRPARRDPHDVSGWSDICDEDSPFAPGDPTTQEIRNRSLDIVHRFEQQYDREDEQMMIRLIKLRQSLWT